MSGARSTPGLSVIGGVGRVLSLTALALVVGGLTLAQTARAHGGEVSIMIEALATDDNPLGTIDYAIKLVFEDGDPVEAAEMSVTADPPDQMVVESIVETVPGIYIARVEFPSDGTWRVTVSYDHPNGIGSVEFSQQVRLPAPGAPVVMVDTVDPERVGTVASESTSILSSTTPGSSGSALPMIVEAFIAEAVDPLLIEYAVVLDGADDLAGDTVTLSATSDVGDEVPATVLSLSAGIHRTTVRYPSGGLWTVVLDIDSQLGRDSVQFMESLPWPHYTTEAGTPKVKLDSLHPEREGQLVESDKSVYLRTDDQPSQPAESTETTIGEPTSVSTVTEPDRVVVEATTPAEELTRDVILRLFHLGSIALWLIPIGAALMNKVNPTSLTIALIGVGLTLGSGLMLMLWGAPVTFPGIFRWEELSTRAYGTPYQLSFLIKMGAVGVGVVGTAAWARRRRRGSLWVIAGSSVVALMAVSAMGQLHLFSHL